MEKEVDNKLMMLAMTCSMFDSPFISDGDDIKTDILILTCLELTVNSYWEKKLCCGATLNLVRRGKNIREKITLSEKNYLKSMQGRSGYNTITKKIK